ncbi:MAG TPA: ATP-dependent metallopeptidase FtsH/Yme1/Tma family protein, partial [Clostridiaceae bacterium]|nr:ATP-dependent metallopeptidase FtsH/Yme1/Tma family protein [Clostridiaceae bacterium]
MKKVSSATAWVAVFIFVLLAAVMLNRTTETITTLNFNDFQKNWMEQNITSFQVAEDAMTVTGTLKDGTKFETVVPSERLFQFISTNPSDGTVQEIYVKPAEVPMWLQYLPTVLLILMLVGFWFMFMQQSQGGGGGNRGVMNFG